MSRWLCNRLRITDDKAIEIAEIFVVSMASSEKALGWKAVASTALECGHLADGGLGNKSGTGLPENEDAAERHRFTVRPESNRNRSAHVSSNIPCALRASSARTSVHICRLFARHEFRQTSRSADADCGRIRKCCTALKLPGNA